MDSTKPHILLADDDIDDCEFFQDALNELDQPYDLTIIDDGVKLMTFLKSDLAPNPDIIFLDLNMPKKSGFECTAEITASSKLSHIPVIIYSTSLDLSVLDNLYEMGASHYIQKPAEFASIKSVIKKALSLSNDTKPNSISKDNFLIQP